MRFLVLVMFAIPSLFGLPLATSAPPAQPTVDMKSYAIRIIRYELVDAIPNDLGSTAAKELLVARDKSLVASDGYRLVSIHCKLLPGENTERVDFKAPGSVPQLTAGGKSCQVVGFFSVNYEAVINGKRLNGWALLGPLLGTSARAEDNKGHYDLICIVPKKIQLPALQVVNQSGKRYSLDEIPQLINIKVAVSAKPSGPVKRDSKTGLPTFKEPAKGTREVRIVNPNDFSISVALISGQKGTHFSVKANGSASTYVLDGRYEVFFIYSSEPNSLYQGDTFALTGNGLQIPIVKVADGNYGIRKVK
jgi:hypothetical protein